MKVVIDKEVELEKLNRMLPNLTDDKDKQSVRFAINLISGFKEITIDETIQIITENAKATALIEFKYNTLVDVILDNTTFLSDAKELRIVSKGLDKIIEAVKYLCTDEYIQRCAELEVKMELLEIEKNREAKA